MAQKLLPHTRVDALTAAWHELLNSMFDAYRPKCHYMRPDQNGARSITAKQPRNPLRSLDLRHALAMSAISPKVESCVGRMSVLCECRATGPSTITVNSPHTTIG
jgi:hypothetical protein